MRTSIAERVHKHRTGLRAAGLRPVQIWVPDTRRSGFAEECRRASLALHADARPGGGAAHELARGDLVSLAGEDPRRRLALIIRSNLFAGHPTLTVVPLTSELRHTPLFRLPLRPAAGNGLREPHEAMADQVQSIPREEVGEILGHLGDDDMLAVDRALAVFLGLV